MRIVEMTITVELPDTSYSELDESDLETLCDNIRDDIEDSLEQATTNIHKLHSQARVNW